MPRMIDADTVEELTPMTDLINALRAGFREQIHVPTRTVHVTGQDRSLLLMPAWLLDGDIGVKVTTFHGTVQPAVQATFLLLDGKTGTPKMILDGARLTLRRTAATSALAASFLAPKCASTLLILGTGALVPHLAEGHSAVRPIKRILVWGRSHIKATQAAREIQRRGFEAQPVIDLRSAMRTSDIISTATSATEPLVYGSDLHPGMHLDLVGAFTPEMIEADPTCFTEARVFVDTRDSALAEGGDLLRALSANTLQPTEIIADLEALCKEARAGRTSDAEITIFKSVGTALEDILAARLIAERLVA